MIYQTIFLLWLSICAAVATKHGDLKSQSNEQQENLYEQVTANYEYENGYQAGGENVEEETVRQQFQPQYRSLKKKEEKQGEKQLDKRSQEKPKENVKNVLITSPKSNADVTLNNLSSYQTPQYMSYVQTASHIPAQTGPQTVRPQSPNLYNMVRNPPQFYTPAPQYPQSQVISATAEMVQPPSNRGYHLYIPSKGSFVYIPSASDINDSTESSIPSMSSSSTSIPSTSSTTKHKNVKEILKSYEYNSNTNTLSIKLKLGINPIDSSNYEYYYQNSI